MQPSILIVEDDSDVRAVIRQALESRNYEVIEAEDGEAGLAQFQSLLPDLSIIDVGLPGAYDGVELCKKIHATHAKHPVLIISGMASPERADRGVSNVRRAGGKSKEPDILSGSCFLRFSCLSNRGALAAANQQAGQTEQCSRPSFFLKFRREAVPVESRAKNPRSAHPTSRCGNFF